MALLIETSPAYRPEKQYILALLVQEFLGLDYEIRFSERPDFRISCPASDREIIISDTLFRTPPNDWLTEHALPSQPLLRWDLEDDTLRSRVLDRRLPVIYGQHLDNPSFLKMDGASLFLGLDVFGSAFFMLTRYEEMVRKDRDGWLRFPTSASLAYQERFLMRPIVNEYLEILWWAIQHCWPQLRRKLRASSVFLSHDVDIPLCARRFSWYRTIRSSAADIIVRQDLPLALRRLGARIATGEYSFKQDVCNTFDWIMASGELLGLKSTFNVLAARDTQQDYPTIDISHRWFQKLLRTIHQRGHEIGFHPSYTTYCDEHKTRQEWSILKMLCDQLHIDQPVWGGRQHYLRWENPTTWQNWENIGLDYDSTLGFADRVGFRCGVCYEYPVFDLLQRKSLNLHERPLVVMEVSLLDYMQQSLEGAFGILSELNAVCRRFNGTFSLLWHNHMLMTRAQRYWYMRTLRECTRT
jgi:hypothetical protein